MFPLKFWMWPHWYIWSKDLIMATFSKELYIKRCNCDANTYILEESGLLRCDAGSAGVSRHFAGITFLQNVRKHPTTQCHIPQDLNQKQLHWTEMTTKNCRVQPQMNIQSPKLIQGTMEDKVHFYVLIKVYPYKLYSN